MTDRLIDNHLHCGGCAPHMLEDIINDSSVAVRASQLLIQNIVSVSHGVPPSEVLAQQILLHSQSVVPDLGRIKFRITHTLWDLDCPLVWFNQDCILTPITIASLVFGVHHIAITTGCMVMHIFPSVDEGVCLFDCIGTVNCQCNYITMVTTLLSKHA